jgi:purine-cytosine permease-like protein
MDQLYEYDREPVPADKLQSGAKFAGLFAGEHVAATEFVIGAFFVLHGVGAADLVGGLILGNVLAVISWTLICAPIATKVRLTLYWEFRRVGGRGLMSVYNLVSGIFFCGIAGAMISVAATAVGLGLGVPSPALNAVYPSGVGWVVITVLIGALMTLIAILGFEKLSQFAEICSPWMFVVFIAGALTMLPQLGVAPDFSNFWEIADSKIWTGVPTPGQERYGFWHITFFAWVCNAAFHFGLIDMATLRYAPNWKYGLYSAFGMFPGHMLAWMCSGVMVAAVAREMNPGLMAYEAAGFAGALAVLVAGWTTANPTLYRAGLAFQAVSPNWPRWRVTLLAGALTTIVSCFPIIFMRLLDYVAMYGLVVVPVGSVVFCEHVIFPRIGVKPISGMLEAVVNKSAAIAWGATVAAVFATPIHPFYKPVLAWVVRIVIYAAIRKASGGER